MIAKNDGLKAFLVFIGFTATGLIYSWPLANYLSEAIPYTYFPDPAHWLTNMFQGDHLQAFYHISMLKLAVSGQIEWFSNPFEFATDSFPNLTSDYFLPLSLIYLPFSYISEPLAYNIMILASFGLSGLAMFLWAKSLTGSTLAAIVAGAVFNFAPVRLVELFGGHPAGHAVFLFPLSLYFFDRAVREKSGLQATFGGLAAFVLSIQYNYFSYFLLMFLMVYIPWRLIPAIRGAFANGSNTRRELKSLAITGIPFAIGLLGIIGYMLWFKSQLVGAAAISGGRSLGEVALYSPKLEHFWNREQGWSIYLGFALLAAPASMLMIFNKTFTLSKRSDTLLFLLAFLVTYILAFGVTLNEKIPLYSLFYNYFPYFNYTRAPAKIMIVTISCLSMLCAFTVAWSTRNSRVALVVALLTAFAVADFHPQRYIGVCRLDSGNPVYEKAASEANGKYILNLPIWPGESSWSSIYSYYSLISGVPTINGYTPLVPKKYIDEIFWPLFPLNVGDLAQNHVERLRDLKVGLVVFHEEAYPPKVSAYPSSFALASLLSSQWLELIYKQEPLWLFRLLDKQSKRATVSVTSPMGSLFETEYLNRIGGQVKEDKDALNGYTLHGGPFPDMAEHILNAGPYRTFPSGRYNVSYRIRLLGSSGIAGPVVKIDISADQGRKILAAKTITKNEFNRGGEYTDFWLGFELTPDTAWQVEFRTYSLGGAEIAVDYMYALRADQSDPRLHYEAEDFYYTGMITADKGASGGRAIVSSPDRDPVSIMAQGPRRKFEAGRYNAVFRMKSSGVKASEIVADIEVISLLDWKPIAKDKVTMIRFNAVDTYSDIKLPFELPTDGFIEVRVKFGGASTLHVDSVKIEPAIN